MEELHQENFYTIKDYRDIMVDIIQRLAICFNLTKDEATLKEEYYFVKGLDRNCYLKFIKEGIKDSTTIFNRINETENMIQNFLLAEGESGFSFKPIIKEENKTALKKWCKVHKTTSHSNEECLVQQKTNKKNTDNKKKNEINMVDSYHLLFLNLKIPKLKLVVKALVDTGSSVTLIDQDTAIKSKFKIIETEEKTVKLANNTETTLKNKVELRTNTGENIILYCMKNLSHDIILGIDSLKKLRIRINFLNNCIYHNKRKIDASKLQIKKSITLVANIQERAVSDDKIRVIISEYMQKINPEKPITGVKFTIPLNSDEIPNVKPFPEPPYKQEFLRIELKNLLDKNIIRKSQSMYSAPCFTKEKPDKTHRLLIDYRKLNSISTVMQYHFPKINEQAHRLLGMNHFSKIDLLKGFYQVEINEKDKHKTAFSTIYGKYEFNRLPFGMVNAPKFFNNLIANVLSEIDNVLIFVDDILIFSETEEEHYILLKRVLNKLAENNIIMNLNKSVFNKNNIHYLGLVFDSEGYKPDLERLKDFRKFKIPETKRQLQKLLGILNWYRPFLKNASIELFNLYEHLKGNKRKLSLTEKDMEPVYKIYEDIKKGIQLYYPDLNKDFFINTDASDHGFGAILYQEKGIVAMHSKKLLETQKRYTTTEKEMYAIFYSIKYWSGLIKGSKITVHTDNKNILYDTADYSKKTERWKAALSEFNIEYKYLKGTENLVADELSREKSHQIIGNINLGRELEKYLVEFHDINAHPGAKTTINTLRKKMKVTKEIKNYIQLYSQKCTECQRCKPPNRSYSCKKGVIMTSDPFTHISSDIFGPFPAHYYNTNLKGKLFIITFTDRCTRFTKVKISRNIQPDTILKALKEEWIKNVTKPLTLLTDNAKCYKNKRVKQELDRLGIKQKFTSPYNPTGNSISERINREIVTVLRIYKKNGLNILKNKIENKMNNLTNSTIKQIPSDLLKDYKNERNFPDFISELKKPNQKTTQYLHNFKKGDLVLTKQFNKHKLEDLYTGPAEIIDIRGEQLRVQNLDGKKIQTVSFKNAKPFFV